MFSPLKICLVMLGLASGCAKSVTIAGQSVKNNRSDLASSSSPQPATGTPVVLPNGLGSDRAYYQTRSVITLQLASNAVELGDVFSLSDAQTGQTLVDHQTVGVGLSLAETALDGSGYALLLELYLASQDMAGKLSYGQNDLHLTVNGSAGKQADHTVYLQDFSFFVSQASYFGSNLQDATGFEGEIAGYGVPVVSNGTSMLSTGLIPTLNN